MVTFFLKPLEAIRVFIVKNTDYLGKYIMHAEFNNILFLLVGKFYSFYF